MDVNHIIVQAGGKGTRLKHLTSNKPKALVPIENLPMLFHLFRQFPDKKFIIIADYKKDVLRAYLESFAKVNYIVVDTEESGTCSGISTAISLLPRDESFMLMWSDLILPNNFQFPKENGNYIGISETFPCRWMYKNGLFSEEKSELCGVAGLFIFKNKTYLENVPLKGEFVRWLSEQNVDYHTIGLRDTREFGTLEEYKKLDEVKTRPFNKMTIKDDIVIKESLDKQGDGLAKREINWYKYAVANNITSVPRIYDYEPLTMEKIIGRNVYEIDADKNELDKIVKKVKAIHSVESIPSDAFSLKEAYYGKTVNRLDQIRNLIPLADRRTIVVNGRECRNVFYYRREFERLLEGLKCNTFTFIHGDCTFSNLMIRNNGEPILIDPRGYFGYTELYGDPNYDWAKLYYSIVGNYDQFNLKNFSLEIKEDMVNLEIMSNGWEKLEKTFFELTETDENTIKLIHAVIWLSLTTYAWQDYDSICGAFYNGIYYLEEVL